MTEIKIKRVYQIADEKDDVRILIDGLWPRGIKKRDAKIDLWIKEIAPSTELRKWFNHEPEKWTEFCRKYYKELNSKGDFIQVILNYLKKHDVTLLYGAKEERFNNAVALKNYLKQQLNL